MMEEQKNNELIARFMGHTFMAKYSDSERLAFREPFGKSWGHEPFNYAKRWDYLMPVVEKISNLRSGKFLSPCSRLQAEIAFHLQDGPKIENVYKAVIEFITWYNGINSER